MAERGTSLPFEATEASRAFVDFIALSRWDVEATSNRLMRTSSTGRTWASLSKLMQREGHHQVEDLGMPAARSWAVHLGILPPEARGDPRDAPEARP